RGALGGGFAQRVAGRTVEDEHLCGGGGTHLDGTAVEADVIGGGDLLPQLRDPALDGKPLGADPFFHATPRRQAALREVFLQPLGDAGRRRPRPDHQSSSDGGEADSPAAELPGAASSSSSASSSGAASSFSLLSASAGTTGTSP